MNSLRDEILDDIIELVFCSFPAKSDEEFRALVRQVLRIVDHAVCEVLKHERHARYLKTLKRSTN